MNYRQNPIYIQVRTSIYAMKRRIVPPMLRWRYRCEEEGVLPDFLIVGAMKSGTTSLYSYLCQHPGIVPSVRKEVQYFADLRNYARGDKWYRSHFPVRQDMQALENTLGYPPVTGEATPAHHLRRYALNAARLIPEAKIIVILRNPVERAFSHYKHMQRKRMIPKMSFQEALLCEEKYLPAEIMRNNLQPGKATGVLNLYSFVFRGQYIDQIKMWLEVYDREQMLLINSESLFQRPEQTCNRVANFLKLPEYHLSELEACNAGNHDDKIDADTAQLLTEHFRSYNRRLFEFVGEDWGWPS